MVIAIDCVPQENHEVGVMPKHLIKNRIAGGRSTAALLPAQITAPHERQRLGLIVWRRRDKSAFSSRRDLWTVNGFIWGPRPNNIAIGGSRLQAIEQDRRRIVLILRRRDPSGSE